MSPNVDNAKRVLDLGTGSGIWAIDYADTHPEAEVYYVTSKYRPYLIIAKRSLASTSVLSSHRC